MRYFYRAFTKTKIYIRTLNYYYYPEQEMSQVDHFKKYGRVTVSTPYSEGRTRVVKANNVFIDTNNHDPNAIVDLLYSLPANMDLRTLDLGDYPEFFI